jgi:hypothetical protein
MPIDRPAGNPLADRAPIDDDVAHVHRRDRRPVAGFEPLSVRRPRAPAPWPGSCVVARLAKRNHGSTARMREVPADRRLLQASVAPERPLTSGALMCCDGAVQLSP